VERLRPYLRHLPAALFIWGVVIGGFAWGWFAHASRVFPYRLLHGMVHEAKPLAQELTGELPDAFVKAPVPQTVIVHTGAAPAPGMTLIAGVGKGGKMMAKLVDFDGKVEHSWDLDWFRIWPDRTGVPGDSLPQSEPGVDVHGVVLEPDGDLVFNYENLGMVKIDFCGRVVWRLARMTHHALVEDDAGHLWALDHIIHTQPDPKFSTFHTPFDEDEVIELSQDGHMMRAISVPRLLRHNGYGGLLYMSSIDDVHDAPCCDFLHTNDVEIFRDRMKEGLFKHGDVMISVRDINTVVVFDPDTRKIRAIMIGRTVRQHDPDFIDGSTISIFDNHNTDRPLDRAWSRILIHDFKTGAERVFFKGGPQHPFYSQTMGKQQWLPNGDLLITEHMHGRAFELNAQGQIVWEYYNQLGGGVIGLINAAQRVDPAKLSVDQARRMEKACPAH
jgi:hypothetical protein